MTRHRVGAVYRHIVKTRLRRLRSLRFDPVKIDWALAALFTVTTQQAIWVAHDGAGHRLGAATLAIAITGPVAVRRRWPTLVGTAVPVLSAIDNFTFNGTSIGYHSRISSRYMRWRCGPRRDGSSRVSPRW